jgi:hypothetical protein
LHLLLRMANLPIGRFSQGLFASWFVFTFQLCCVKRVLWNACVKLVTVPSDVS